MSSNQRNWRRTKTRGDNLNRNEQTTTARWALEQSKLEQLLDNAIGSLQTANNVKYQAQTMGIKWEDLKDLFLKDQPPKSSSVKRHHQKQKRIYKIKRKPRKAQKAQRFRKLQGAWQKSKSTTAKHVIAVTFSFDAINWWRDECISTANRNN